jgi:GT2 family glycosyltransferase
MSKVLLAFPTSSAKDYCLKEFCKQLCNITYPCDILIVDNSKKESHIKKIQQELKLCNKYVFYIHLHEKIGINNLICKCHNEIKKHVLENGYDYLFSLESDIFIPANIVEHLLSFNKQVIGLPYFIGHGFQSTHICCESETFGKIQGHMPMTANRAFNNFHDGTVKQCNQLGLGCILIHKSTLEKINFRIEEGSSWDTFDDTFFHRDLQNLGIPVWCDTNNMAIHINKPWRK